MIFCTLRDFSEAFKLLEKIFVSCLNLNIEVVNETSRTNTCCSIAKFESSVAESRQDQNLRSGE